MNTQFNTIEEICNGKDINKSEAYLLACDKFEVEASKYANHESFLCKKFAEEVSLSFNKAKNADCVYSVYVNTFAAEKWLQKAYETAQKYL